MNYTNFTYEQEGKVHAMTKSDLKWRIRDLEIDNSGLQQAVKRKDKQLKVLSAFQFIIGVLTVIAVYGVLDYAN